MSATSMTDRPVWETWLTDWARPGRNRLFTTTRISTGLLAVTRARATATAARSTGEAPTWWRASIARVARYRAGESNRACQYRGWRGLAWFANRRGRAGLRRSSREASAVARAPPAARVLGRRSA